MEELNWYNWNAHRDYPLDRKALLDSGQALPREMLLDAGFLFGPAAGFDPTTSLLSVFNVYRNSASGLCRVRFYYSNDTVEGYLQGVFYTTPGAATPPGTIIPLTTLPAGLDVQGFIVLGDTSAFVPLIPATRGRYILGEDGDAIFVEPRCVQSLYNGAVTRVSMYRKESTRWAPPGEEPAAETTIPVIRDLVGDPGLTVVKGYNVSVAFNVADNALEITAGLGLGLGQTCDTSSFAGEPFCGDLIASINGLPATGDGIFLIDGDNGVEIAADPGDSHGIIVGLGDIGKVYCASSVVSP